MAESETRICNQALTVIGAKRINDLETDDNPRAIACRTFYEPDRDALIRSHRWRFAAARATLSQDTVDPDFEFDNQFILPSDFMAERSLYDSNGGAKEIYRDSYSIEGERLLTDADSVDLRYTKKVTDPSKFDPLFVKLLVYTLADDLIGPLAGGSAKVQAKVDKRLDQLMPRVRAMDRNETENTGRSRNTPWSEVRTNRANWRSRRV
jgi:hypothetical protein